MTHPIARLDGAGLQRFQSLRRAAVDAVALRFEADPEGVYARFGERGREACREDLAYHLDFLRPVLEFGLLQPMSDYLRWLDGVLSTRGIPAHHLPLSLDWLAEFFAAAMAPPQAQVVVDALGLAKAQLLGGDDPSSAIYALMPERWPECDALEAALLAGDRGRAQALLDQALASGRGIVDIELHLIQPALYGIGLKWQGNQVSVAQEHLATALAQYLMNHGLSRSNASLATGKRMLLACVEGNNHAVGLQMVADAFFLAGWETQLLGPNVPTAALMQQVASFKPDWLALSVSFAHQLRTVSDIMRRLDQGFGAARPRVIVGGLAINQFEPLAGRLGVDAWGANPKAALLAVSRIGSGAAAA